MRVTGRGPSALVTVLAIAGMVGVTGASAQPGPVTSSSASSPDSVFGPSWRTSSDLLVTGVGDSRGFHILDAREHSAFTWQNVVTLGVPGTDTGPWTGQVCATGDGRYAIAVYAPSAAANNPATVEAGARAAVVDLATGSTSLVADGVELAYFSPSCGAGDEAIIARAFGTDGQVTQLLHIDARTARTDSATTVAAEVTTPVQTASGDYAMVNGWLSRIGAHGEVAKVAKPDGQPFTLTATAHGAIDVATTVDGRAELERWTGHTMRRVGYGSLSDFGLFPQTGGADAVVGDVSGLNLAGLTDIRAVPSAQQPRAISAEGHLVATQVLPAEIRDLTTKTTAAPSTRPAPDQDTGVIQIAGVAIRTGQLVTGTVAADGAATAPPAQPAHQLPVAPPQPNGTGHSAESGVSGQSLDSAVLRDGPPHGDGVQASAIIPMTSTTPPPTNPAASNDSEIAVPLTPEDNLPNGVSVPTCQVPRNDPSRQVLQPSPNMVEWAVDQAVHGDLTMQRPANYLGTGEPAYTPQGLFPPVALSTGGTIPAQVVLGILAQESNFKQASWHAVPGDGGNPLISDYYGTTTVDSSGTIVVPADDPNYLPNYSNTDCGYGLGQVTTGMSFLNTPQFTAQQAVAVATDYAANIAASVQILATTWNQLAAMNPPMLLNGGNPKYIENWYLAIWAYNSGVHLQSDAASNGGHYGVGWVNNPVNPHFPSNLVARGFQPRTSPSDATTPQDWPYEELVMGWINQPMMNGSSNDYALPTWQNPANTSLNRPPRTQFCSTSVNSCDPTQAAPCPSVSSACWWNQPATWIAGLGQPGVPPTSAVENLFYTLGSGEPAITKTYANDCVTSATFYSQYPTGTLLVGDLADTNENVRGCLWSNGTTNGKFALRLGDNVAVAANMKGVLQANPLTAQVDLHQIGGGFLGHFYFTHTYDGTLKDTSTTFSSLGTAGSVTETTQVPTGIEHKVTGAWTPAIPRGSAAAIYDIQVALPDHGANATGVTYVVEPGGTTYTGGTSLTCTVNQNIAPGQNTWLDLGDYSLKPGADLTLDNMVPGASGSLDVAFSAAVFIPDPGQTRRPCSGGTAGTR